MKFVGGGEGQSPLGPPPWLRHWFNHVSNLKAMYLYLIKTDFSSMHAYDID